MKCELHADQFGETYCYQMEKLLNLGEMGRDSSGRFILFNHISPLHFCPWCGNKLWQFVERK